MKRYLRLAVVALIAVCVGVFLVATWFPNARCPDYEFETAWGTSGSGHGEFHELMGVAVAGNEVFVSDAENDRIQVFDRGGKFLRHFGKHGAGLGELRRPMRIEVHGEHLFVTEYLNDRIQVFSLAGKPLRLIGSKGKASAQFDSPSGVSVNQHGHIAVADFSNHRVQVFADPDTLMVQLGDTGKPGICRGRLNHPSDVAVADDGTLFVADSYNHRILAFDAGGERLQAWGGPLAVSFPGSANGWFHVAAGVTVGPRGKVFVADFYNHRIQKFTPEGKFLAAFGEPGIGKGQLDRPTDVAVDLDGTVYVADFGNNRIQKWRPGARFPYD